MSSVDESERRTVAERLAEVEEVDVRVEKLVAGGDGFARFDGIPIFVPRAVPGDLLRIRLTDRRPGYGRGEIVEVVEPSPDRRPPPCRHFDRCGGCDLQQIDDERQVDLKVEASLETLRRLGRVELPSTRVEVIAGDPWRYRLRTQIHTAPAAGGAPTEVGYFARGTHNLVAVAECPVLSPALEQAVIELAAELPPDAPRRIDLAVGDDGGFAVSPLVGDLPHGELRIAVGDFTYRFDARCFFQAHRQLLETLIDRVVGDATGAQAYDLYAGVGLFTVPLAERYAEVVAVESDRIAMRYARKNVRANASGGVALIASAVESWIDRLPKGAARVVVDPPRTGLSAIVRRALSERPAERLTYVSCNAATLARDLRQLAEAYDVERLHLFDLFPQTGHMEAVVQLGRRSENR